MRLIDADALIELLRHNKEISADTGDKVIAVDIDTVIRCVANQPTAYDVDKVIEQLKDRSTLSRPVGWTRSYEIVTLDDAIEIVKSEMKESGGDKEA